MFWKGVGAVCAIIGLCVLAIVSLSAHYSNLDNIEANELRNCTYGGPSERIRATEYYLASAKIEIDFRNCLHGNGNGDVRLCENVAYKLNGLKPLNENDYGDKIFMEVIANVKQCGGK